LIAAGVAVGLAPAIAGMPVPSVVFVPLRPAVTRRLFAVTVDGVQAPPVRALLEELRSAAAQQGGGLAPALTPP